jgi:hypothetical protein
MTKGLDELGLGYRPGDLEDGLVGEDGSSLGDRIDVAGEPEVLEPLEKVRREPVQRRQVIERLSGEAKRLQVSKDVVEPAGEQIVAGLRETAGEQAEHGLFLHPLPPVRLEHRELIQVGEERGVAVVDPRCGGHGTRPT